MQNYKTVVREAEAEFTEKRSRFIAQVAPVQNEEEALALVNLLCNLLNLQPIRKVKHRLQTLQHSNKEKNRLLTPQHNNKVIMSRVTHHF